MVIHPSVFKSSNDNYCKWEMIAHYLFIFRFSDFNKYCLIYLLSDNENEGNLLCS